MSGFFLLSAAILVLGFLWAYRAGKADQDAKNKDNVQENLRRTNDVRDLLRRSSSYARRVRKKFTR